MEHKSLNRGPLAEHLKTDDELPLMKCIHDKDILGSVNSISKTSRSAVLFINLFNY